MLAENERQFKRSRQRHYIRDACTEWQTVGKMDLAIQILCLLRLTDTEASRFGRPNPMLAKSRRHEQATKDGRPKAVLAESDGHSCKRVCHYKTYAC